MVGNLMFCNLLSQNFFKSDIFKVLVFFLITAIIFLIIKAVYGKKKQASYFVKDSLLTKTEIKYYNLLCSILGDRFLVLPQINLASVIDKKGGNNFRNELFRNADFGVFDYNYRPIFLVEINDNTHFRKDRLERDKKVNEICEKAGLPILTLWVKDGIDAETIKKQIQKILRRQK
ncbi:MAG: DUF2726 domain-containing protein [Clostridia bacterium]|nr:DUF2726 domain-containing protein [Clostridia bacterium]